MDKVLLPGSQGLHTYRAGGGLLCFRPELLFREPSVGR